MFTNRNPHRTHFHKLGNCILDLVSHCILGLLAATWPVGKLFCFLNAKLGDLHVWSLEAAKCIEQEKINMQLITRAVRHRVEVSAPFCCYFSCSRRSCQRMRFARSSSAHGQLRNANTAQSSDACPGGDSWFGNLKEFEYLWRIACRKALKISSASSSIIHRLQDKAISYIMHIILTQHWTAENHCVSVWGQHWVQSFTENTEIGKCALSDSVFKFEHKYEPSGSIFSVWFRELDWL